MSSSESRSSDRRDRGGPRRPGATMVPGVERLEGRALLAAPNLLPIGTPPAPDGTLSQADVQVLLQRAAAATASDNAIVAVVDRSGDILGVRVEGGVSPAITGDVEKLVFSIDGAVSEARTGAFFASNPTPLTSRTIQNLSESTVTQREVQSDPNVADPNSASRGPGTVSAIGIKGHFPARVMFQPQVDLFQIEQTNRDSVDNPGPDMIKGTSDDIMLPNRFNVPSQYIPLPSDGSITDKNQVDPAPESYGTVSGLLPSAQSRGIGTLPGGIPIFKNGKLVGGIGVFFPGTTGFASEENSVLNDAGFYDPNKPDLAEEAEYIAFVAVGGSSGAGLSTNTPAFNQKLGVPSFPAGEKFDLPAGRIDLVGITLDVFGPQGDQGPAQLVNYGRQFGIGDPNSGVNEPISPAGATLGNGQLASQGWLVVPHASADGTITQQDVTNIVARGVAEARTIRSAIRLPLNSHARMVFSVTDKAGNVLGLYRMPDATIFSIHVAVTKARNVAYYDDASQLQPIDQVAGLAPGVSLTARTFRFLALPHFPEGIDTYPPGPFSILNDIGVRNGTAPIPASSIQSVEGYTSFNPIANFHDPNNIANQSGVVYFPGSSGIYKTINGVPQLVGGFGASGDGVDQDDDITFVATLPYAPPEILRADQYFVRGVRLPYQKFNRQPHLPIGNNGIDIDQQPPAKNNPAVPVLPGPIATNLSPHDKQRINLARAHALAVTIANGPRSSGR